MLQFHPLVSALKRHRESFHPVLMLDPEKDRIASLDLSSENLNFTSDIYSDIEKFKSFIDMNLQATGSKFLYGGYCEPRDIYSVSSVFDADHSDDEPRRIHVGIDIWGKAGTPVHAPIGGVLHSMAMNDGVGDYGSTLVLQHQLDGIAFHTLYGHMSASDLVFQEGSYIMQGQEFAHFGMPHENGNWPPHLHFQIIIDMELNEGDYPGVCRVSELLKYAFNCPDPEPFFQITSNLHV
jgi:murein DD-endopeptidase MepM/ murein hydrolase activator NlpD